MCQALPLQSYRLVFKFQMNFIVFVITIFECEKQNGLC